jgi:hypothetical protein
VISYFSIEMIPSFFIYCSYSLVLFAILNALFEVEYNDTAQFHLRWYKITNNELLLLKWPSIIVVITLLFLIHLILYFCFSNHPIVMVVSDIIALVIALLTAYFLTWVYTWSLKMQIRLSSITEVLLLISIMIFPISIIAGLVLRSKLRKMRSA